MKIKDYLNEAEQEILNFKHDGKSVKISVNVINPYSPSGSKDKKPTVSVPGLGHMLASELSEYISLLTKALKLIQEK